MADTLTVRTAGITTVQDLGRVGRSRYGLPANGAADQHSAGPHISMTVLEPLPAAKGLVVDDE
ncbi:hypothetical protein F9278_44010 [Streptomyces phaeolivaceus]|uniref:Uncharacterized protein n=2 Tax=Streptomyces phaeolivaceus TaxID=2653200 RepID=A0A5P8KF73_9ACTN|nr:hypothetical protein F9278_44010 [Streptomyces phaeolivaceus]